MAKKTPRPIPRFEHPIIETHCHLDYLDLAALDDTLDAAITAGVEQFVTIAVSPDNLSVVADLTKRSDRIWGTQGIHPHEASHWNPEVDSRVREGTSGERIVAVGEIGLDYYYDHADRKAQAAAFEAQLQIAVDTNLPIVVHTRDADDDTRAILANFSGKLAKKGVIHSFTSSLALAEFCLAEGFYLGFNGICTFKTADNVRAVVAATPLEQLVLETDSPYLTPVPYRGRVNSPKYLPFIAEQVADVKSIDVEALLVAAHHNSHQLFFEAT